MATTAIAIRYFSRGGNTRKLAEAMAEGVGITAQEIPAPINEPVDVLFLGGAVYYGGIDKQLKSYIQTLDAHKVGKVIVFSTSSLSQRAYPQMRRELERAGLRVSNADFYCKSAFGSIHKGHPNAADLEAARAFAQKHGEA